MVSGLRYLMLLLCGTELCRAATTSPQEPEDSAVTVSVHNHTDLYEALDNGTLETEQPALIVTTSDSPGPLPTDTPIAVSDPPVLLSDPGSPDSPQSRSVSAFVTSVVSLCVCDLLVSQCDVNCCCDPDCSASDFSIFSGCSIPLVIGDRQLCTQDAVLYSISGSNIPQRITETVQVVNPNIFCIYATNYQPALSFITPDNPTVANFDSLLKEFGGNQFNTENGAQNAVGSAAARNATKYKFGSPILTLDSYMKLPARLGTGMCTDNSPVGFLENKDVTCSRNIQIENCSIPVLTLETYKNIQILPVPNSQHGINVTVRAVTLISIDGILILGNQSDYLPSYDNNTGVCSNIVLEGSYTMTYTDQGEITSVALSLVLGAVKRNMIQQKFHIQFIENGATPVPLSGNPGYVYGLPLVAGFKLPQSGIIQSTNRFGQLTLLKSSSDQNCLTEEGKRAPVLFGYNMMSGCRLRINYTDSAFCQVTADTIMNALKGQQFPDYVAQFGNTKPENVLDWVQINTISTSVQPSIQTMCKIPVSLELEVRWTKFGSLVNTQAQIVDVSQRISYAFIPNNIGSGRFVQISTSVTFLDVSQSAVPGYKAQPTIDAKLPFDFFHPFL